MGLPILESPEAAVAIATGDDVEVDLDGGVIVNHTRQETYQAQTVPPFMQQLLQAGGLMNYVRQQMAGVRLVMTEGYPRRDAGVEKALMMSRVEDY